MQHLLQTPDLTNEHDQDSLHSTVLDETAKPRFLLFQNFRKASTSTSSRPIHLHIAPDQRRLSQTSFSISPQQCGTIATPASSAANWHEPRAQSIGMKLHKALVKSRIPKNEAAQHLNIIFPYSKTTRAFQASWTRLGGARLNIFFAQTVHPVDDRYFRSQN